MSKKKRFFQLSAWRMAEFEAEGDHVFLWNQATRSSNWGPAGKRGVTRIVGSCAESDIQS